MKEFEYFIPQLNGWLSLYLEDLLLILFSRDESAFTKIKIPKGLPLCPKDVSSQKIEKKLLLPGNFIETKINRNLFLETNQKNSRIQLALNSNKNTYSINKDIWHRAKIISYDENTKLLFVEVNDNIEIIDNFDLIRPLKEIKYVKNDLLAYNIKSIQKSDYERIKNEIDKANNNNNGDSISDNNRIFEMKYDSKNSCFTCIGNRDIFRNISLLKQYEARNKKNISEEPYTNSDFSNPNSNNNLIGIGIKSPSGKSENSENNSNKNIILEKEIKEEINNYKYNFTLTYRDKFKKDIEKEAEELIQNCKYFIGKKYENNFDLTIYGNDEQDFIEEKNIFEKQYKQVMLESDATIDKNEINDLAIKSKIKFFCIDKKCLYLIGEEKNINNFKVVWNLTKQYSKEIQKENKEKENIQKELMSLKKKHKIKK